MWCNCVRHRRTKLETVAETRLIEDTEHDRRRIIMCRLPLIKFKISSPQMFVNIASAHAMLLAIDWFRALQVPRRFVARSFAARATRRSLRQIKVFWTTFSACNLLCAVTLSRSRLDYPNWAFRPSNYIRKAKQITDQHGITWESATSVHWTPDMCVDARVNLNEDFFRTHSIHHSRALSPVPSQYLWTISFENPSKIKTPRLWLLTS